MRNIFSFRDHWIIKAPSSGVRVDYTYMWQFLKINASPNSLISLDE